MYFLLLFFIHLAPRPGIDIYEFPFEGTGLLNQTVALAILRYAHISCFCWHLPFINCDPSSRVCLLGHFPLLCSNYSSPCYLSLRAFYTLTSTYLPARISWVWPGIPSGCVYQRNLPHFFPHALASLSRISVTKSACFLCSHYKCHLSVQEAPLALSGHPSSVIWNIFHFDKFPVLLVNDLDGNSCHKYILSILAPLLSLTFASLEELQSPPAVFLS